MATPSHQADIAKTYENNMFLLILGGWRLDNGHFGCLGELLAGFWLARWQLDGWLVGCLLVAGRLAGHRDPRS